METLACVQTVFLLILKQHWPCVAEDRWVLLLISQAARRLIKSIGMENQDYDIKKCIEETCT